MRLDQDREPDRDSYYRFVDDYYPIKIGDVFLGPPTLFVNPPLATLDPRLDLEDLADGQPVGNVRINPPIPEAADESYGPILGAPTSGGQGYGILVSHTCDYASKQGHPYRQLSPIYPLSALPDQNGLRGLVWFRPYSGSTAFFPLPPIGQNPVIIGPDYLPFKSFVNLRHVTTIHSDVLSRMPRVASLTPPAKHLFLHRLGKFHLRVPVRLQHFEEIDARYAEEIDRP